MEQTLPKCSFMKQLSEISIVNNLSDGDKKKYHSILPDLITGWRPKNFRIAAPILITYQNILNDAILKHYRQEPDRLIYLGPRYSNSYKFHSMSSHNYVVRYGIKCEEMPTNLQKGLEQFSIKCHQQKRPFVGMSPQKAMQNQLQFDSNFESGNLDLVYKVSDTEYNLFLRPDTNTQGHTQWFYFKIKNHNFKHSQIQINICNNRKYKTLFHRGMKPFIYSKYLEKIQNKKWHQGGSNIKYTRLNLKQTFDYFCSFQNQTYSSQELFEHYYCLSFEYTFTNPNDTVYFAYCQPYTYSEMRSHVTGLKKKSENNGKITIIQENLCTSLSGLQIPLLTITDPTVAQNQKKCVIAIARIHPGESNGSHVMKGFLNYIISDQAQQLRQKVIFKVVPMINPDGVVFGNYRTGLGGKDLNRKFKAKSIDLFPEVINLRKYVEKNKKELECKMLYFLDFHGHSMKKNVFLYGPQYDVWTTKYERARLLPRILANNTQMFRFQSCSFRVAQMKKSTARAFMLSLIPYCYTIQSSVGLYKKSKLTKNFQFSGKKWEQMGEYVGKGIRDCMMKLFEGNITSLPLFPQKKKKEKKSELLKLKEIGGEIKSNETLTTISCKSSQSLDEKGSKKHLNSLKKFKKSPILTLKIPEIVEEDHESDAYSEGESDCESQGNDLDKERYEHISGKIIKFLENFSKQIIGERKKYCIKLQKKALLPLKSVNYRKKNQNDHMKLVPSLKHKIGRISEKRIFFQQKEDSVVKGLKASLHKCREYGSKT